jgi:hypothetical protein
LSAAPLGMLRPVPSGRPAEHPRAEASGIGLEGDNISPLVAWALIGTFVATRRFRWEPQAGTG